MYKDIDDYEILYMIQENDDYYEIMLEKYKPLIITICQKKLISAKDKGYELEDLIQVANLALFEAIQNYDENKNVKFYTYLAHCINNKLITELRDHSTNKKRALNSSISYEMQVAGTKYTLLETLPDEKAINPYDYLNIEEQKEVYIKFINSLPFEVAVVYELKINGFTPKEIKKIMDIDDKILNKCLKVINQKLNLLQNIH